MYRITEKQVKCILDKMRNKDIDITIDGSIRINKRINKLEYCMNSGIIKLEDKDTKEYMIFNLNEAYSTMTNKNKDIIQANIDSLNNDTIVTIREYKKAE